MKNNIPKVPTWRKIFEDLQREFATRDLKCGDPFYSLRDITQKYQTSEITAKRAFSELAAKGFIKKIPGKGTFVQKNSSIHEIILLLPENHRSMIYYDILRGVSEAAQETGISLTTITNDLSLAEVPPDRGFIFIEGVYVSDAEALKKFGKNVVAVHFPTPLKSCSTVGIDFEKGACLAVKHLLDLGHKRIAMIGGNVSGVWFTSRYEGYLRALRSRRINMDLKLIKETTGENMEEDRKALQELMEMNDPPTAIFAGTDVRAFHLLGYCAENGIKVPEQLSIVGFDNSEGAGYSTPPLTTIDTHRIRLGCEAVYLLVDLINGKREKCHLEIEPTLIQRQSAAPIKQIAKQNS